MDINMEEEIDGDSLPLTELFKKEDNDDDNKSDISNSSSESEGLKL